MIAGISNGAIWALVAIGYTLVYGIVELINFAHGEVFMIGSFISASFFTTIGLTQGMNTAALFFGLLLTLIVAMIGSGMLNAMIERVGYRPLRSAPKLAPLITAVGFSFILQNVGLLWKGGSQVGIPDLINAQHTVVDHLRHHDRERGCALGRRDDSAADRDDDVHRQVASRQGHARDGAGP